MSTSNTYNRSVDDNLLKDMADVSMEDNLLIDMADVSMRFDGNDILRDINLKVYRGDFLAISGPNGGGKTTLLRILLRLLKPTSGSVTYYSDGDAGDRLKIGYLPQKSMIDTKFPISVHDAVKSGLARGFFGRVYSSDAQKVANVEKLCGILDITDRPVGVLSGGQLQRTLLARAIVSQPDVLVLDEPLSYVDKQFEQQLYSIIEEIARTTTIILVSHEMSVISGMANRHVIIDHSLTECHASHHAHPAGCE